MGDPYCKAGKLDTYRRAYDLMRSLARKKTPFTQLTQSQKSILAEGAGFEGVAAYNEGIGTTGGAVNVHGELDDPFFVLSIVSDPADLAFTIEDCAAGDCSPWVLLGILPIIPSGAAKKIPQVLDIVRFGTNAPGLARHHGILDVWAAFNIPGYVRRNTQAPVIVLTVDQHKATIEVFNQWRKQLTGSITGKLDWTNISPREMQTLSERMFDAAGVPVEAREAYYRAIQQYIYGELP